MAMIVPKYERQISRVSPSVSTPQELPPPEAAFGGEKAKALQNLGETGQKIAGLMVQRAQERQTELMVRDNQNKDTAFGQIMLDYQYNNGLDDNGRPKGLLNRKLEQADGITQEFNQTYLKLRKQLLDSIPDVEQKDALARMLDARFETIQNRIVTHERQQIDESFKLSHESSLTLQETEAAQLQDSASLSMAIDKAVGTQENLNRFMGYDPETAKVKNNEAVTKIAKSAFKSAVINSIDLSQTKSFLNGIKDKISQSVYNEISEDIEKTQKQNAEKIKRIQAENVQLTKLAVDKAEDDLVVKKINNQLTEVDVREALSQGAIRPKFADSLSKSLISLKTVDAKTDPATYSDMVDLILSPNRKASEVREKLLNAYNEGGLSETDFKQLYKTRIIPSQTGQHFSIAEEYSDEMAKANEPPRLGFIRTAVEMLKTFGQVANAANPLTITAPLIKQLFNRIEAGNTPDNGIQEVAKELVKEKIKSDNPIVGFLDDVPNAIATKGAIKHAYPGSTKLKPESTYKGELDRQAKYEIGDTVTYNNKEYIVVDFDSDGEPLLEEAENAR